MTAPHVEAIRRRRLDRARGDRFRAEFRLLQVERERDAALADVERLRALINTPIVDDFVEGLRVEVAHQRERWGEAHDAGKSADDWYWTLGHLAAKARQAADAGDLDKLRHHLIASAALLANWHRHASGGGGS